jgi:trans-2,3-dihydro-3-hydroxyanthranilate isomerase
MARRLHIVDVFTDKPCTGNPLAVVLGAHGLTARQMQAFAREMNFSETTFVMSDEPVAGAWPVRIYTPTHELPFAGHPTLGTAHVLRTEMLAAKSARVTLELGVGRVPVVMERTGRRELYWMRPPTPSFGARVARREAAALLGVTPSDIDGKYPSLEVVSGIGYLVVPVRSRAALARATINAQVLNRVCAKLEAKAVIAFAPGAKDARNHHTARVFCDYYGVPEDAATGSANGCLAAWLVETGYCEDDATDVRVEQGAQMGRPSLLHLRAMRTSRGIEVRVGGGVVDVVRGAIVAAPYA